MNAVLHNRGQGETLCPVFLWTGKLSLTPHYVLIITRKSRRRSRAGWARLMYSYLLGVGLCSSVKPCLGAAKREPYPPPCHQVTGRWRNDLPAGRFCVARKGRRYGPTVTSEGGSEPCPKLVTVTSKLLPMHLKTGIIDQKRIFSGQGLAQVTRPTDEASKGASYAYPRLCAKRCTAPCGNPES